MKYGICIDYSRAAILAETGYDYIEMNLTSIKNYSDEEFSTCKKALDDTGIKAEAFNCFFPGNLRLTGENPDFKNIREYAVIALDRASKLGCKIAVLGSGAARNIPIGYQFEKGYEQFIRVLQIAGDAAKINGITIAVEPLCKAESNIIKTVEEGLTIVKAVNHTNVKCLADLYHVYQNNEGFEAIAAAGKNLMHVHISSPIRRVYPVLNDEYDFTSFFDALKKCGYDSRISVEAGVSDFEGTIKETLQAIKRHR